MFLRNLFTALRMPHKRVVFGLMREGRSYVRLHFLYAAVLSGVLRELRRPATREELIRNLGVRRPELLDALLDLGLSLGELRLDGDRFAVRGRYSRTLMNDDGDALSAVVEANVTYYNSVYRHLADRMMGAPRGDYLPEIGGVVARFSRIGEPFIRNFIRVAAAGRGSVRILDVGCGSGGHLLGAAEVNPEAVGVGLEVDPPVAEMAGRNLESWGIADRFRVVTGDVRQPPADLGGPFDLVMMINVIYYFPVADRSDLFRSTRDLLAPGGRLAVASNFQSNGRDPWAANLDAATRSMVGCHPLPKPDEIKTQMKTAGFSDVRARRLMPGSCYFGLLAS